MGNVPAREWMEIIQRPWPEIRAILLDESEEGKRLRQNDPFCGILTPTERWVITARPHAMKRDDVPADYGLERRALSPSPFIAKLPTG